MRFTASGERHPKLCQFVRRSFPESPSCFEHGGSDPARRNARTTRYTYLVLDDIGRGRRAG